MNWLLNIPALFALLIWLEGLYIGRFLEILGVNKFKDAGIFPIQSHPLDEIIALAANLMLVSAVFYLLISSL